MSFMEENSVYQEMIDMEVGHKSSFLECNKKSLNPLLLQNNEKYIEHAMVANEEIVANEDDAISEEGTEDMRSSNMETPVYLEQNLETCEEVTVDYDVPSPLANVPNFKIKQEWCEDNIDERISLINEDETTLPNDEKNEVEGEEDETIATFVTADGQQLALYAVEDSDEIFAVAVYNESGDPPTGFQFLMKSDVERLIGEGAVHTVKKPTQIKKQMWTAEPTMLVPKEESYLEESEDEDETEDLDDLYQFSRNNSTRKNLSTSRNSRMVPDTLTVNSDVPCTDKESELTYLMMNDCDDNVVCPPQQGQESTECEEEIVEQSTVQYILLENDNSDSELTFDDIQATLENIKSFKSKSTQKKLVNKKSVGDQKAANGMIAIKSPPGRSGHFKSRIICHNLPREPNFEYTMPQRSVGPRKNYISNSLFGRKHVAHEGQQNTSSSSLPGGTAGLLDAKQISSNIPSQNATVGTIQVGLKVKRSRKQQLTSVNRGDSEIIIQPASLVSEEETSYRRRGRRKKKRLTDPDYSPRTVKSKKIKRSRKHAMVEVIEIDVDEEEGTSQRNNEIIEITIDDNKEKGSSDKENEVIMVGDSDDELQERATELAAQILQCEYCSRSFRQQRALDTHSRVCPKSPSSTRKLNKKIARRNSGQSEGNSLSDQSVQKQYACKVCQKKFNVVVALARHVRAEHRKKGRSHKSAVDEKFEESSHEQPPPEVTSRENETAATVEPNRRKRSQSSNRSWNVKKLNCTDCGRWFPSAALLASHCLQHATKKSEQQIRQCQTCKKFIKSRVLYIRHVRMHNKAKKKPTLLTNVLQKKLRRTRQVSDQMFYSHAPSNLTHIEKVLKTHTSKSERWT